MSNISKNESINFEVDFVNLLHKCESIIIPKLITGKKWKIISSNRFESPSVIDQIPSIKVSTSFWIGEILKTEEFNNVKVLFENDSGFKKAKFLTGNENCLKYILQSVIEKSSFITRNRISVDIKKAIQFLNEYKKMFLGYSFKLSAKCRLVGAVATFKSIKLGNGVEIVRLTRSEVNKKQPISNGQFSDGILNSNFAINRSVELRFSYSESVSSNKENALIESKKDFVKLAKEALNEALQAILVVKPGVFALSEIEWEGGLPPLGIVSRASDPNERNWNSIGMMETKILKEDISKINAILGLSKSSDVVILRAMKRFEIGRNRFEFSDKLIDYITAWESILLTSGTDPMQGELSYRFSINGAALFAAAKIENDRKGTFQRLKCAYEVRSQFVHGAGKKNLDKALSKGEFKSLNSLCVYLENSFRNTVIWLAMLEASERPYHKNKNWINLIWP